jgi:hypothetical protein
MIDVVNNQVGRQHGGRLALIDAVALTAAKKWEYSANRVVDWDWRVGYNDFRFRHPKRFELAIWADTTLVSLTLGRPTYHGGGMRLDFIEANPDVKRLRVTPIALLALTAYAKAVGANEIRIMNPINDEVKEYYGKLGLKYVKHGDYLYQKI